MIDLNDVWIYVYKNGEVQYTDLINVFVNTGKRSKATLLKYKTQLEAAGKLKKKISMKTNRPVYFVPEEFHEEVEKMIKESECNSCISSLDAKWLGPLRNLLIRMKNEDPILDFECFCFTFIGNIPCAFPKSVEAMETYISQEKSFRERHARDLERKFKELNYSKVDGAELEAVRARIGEEVGWTVGEYLEKLLKKAEKQKGVRKIMTLYGITEEMLTEMYKEKG